MKCPICQEALVMADRNGIEVDYCPDCRGVWLDQGELDKIIERSTQQNADLHKNPYQNREYYHSEKVGHIKKRKNFLDEIFDF